MRTVTMNGVSFLAELCARLPVAKLVDARNPRARAAQRASGARAELDAAHAVKKPVEREQGPVARHCREHTERKICEQRSGDSHERAGDTRLGAGESGVGGGEVLEYAAVTRRPVGAHRERSRMKADGRAVNTVEYADCSRSRIHRTGNHRLTRRTAALAGH